MGRSCLAPLAKLFIKVICMKEGKCFRQQGFRLGKFRWGTYGGTTGVVTVRRPILLMYRLVVFRVVCTLNDASNTTFCFRSDTMDGYRPTSMVRCSTVDVTSAGRSSDVTVVLILSVFAAQCTLT